MRAVSSSPEINDVAGADALGEAEGSIGALYRSGVADPAGVMEPPGGPAAGQFNCPHAERGEPHPARTVMQDRSAPSGPAGPHQGSGYAAVGWERRVFMRRARS